ncbi:MAG: hypothetical protein V2A73_19715 [Pseudomonadota bacterium]
MMQTAAMMLAILLGVLVVVGVLPRLLAAAKSKLSPRPADSPSIGSSVTFVGCVHSVFRGEDWLILVCTPRGPELGVGEDTDLLRRVLKGIDVALKNLPGIGGVTWR